MSPPTARSDVLGAGPPPEWVAAALLSSGAPEPVWLDHALGEGWSALAAWPDARLRTYPPDPDPLPALEALAASVPDGPEGIPAPHLVTALGYDLGARTDRFFWKAKDDLGEPDLDVRRYPAVLLHDGRSGTWRLSALDAKSREEGARRYAPLLEACRDPGPPPPAAPARAEGNLPPEPYRAAVREALGLIQSGECYQVNLARRFRVPCPDPFAAYRRLRRLSPAPYAAFLGWEGRTVLSSSPELFLERSGSRLLTRPIKGTRPRGATPAEDARLREELEASEKDRAELAMIVDLERNDLGRVCRTGSVKVEIPRAIASYATVHHAFAEVSGELKAGLGLVDLLRAAFPGGSVTGCPRLRAMEAIDALEPTRRGIYCGSVGWASASRACLNLAIRTFAVGDGTASVHAGGGIVADSDPEAERLETLAKARAMLAALGVLESA